MAYDRAERFRRLAPGTPCDVGPGTYDVSESADVFRNLGKCIGNTWHMPGEKCHYYFRPGGVSIDYTDARFKERLHEGPGPADYDIDNNLSDRKCGRKRDHPGTWKGSQGKLWLVPPPRTVGTSGVSVPSKQDTNGYSFDKRGHLVKNPSRTEEPTFFYDVPREELNLTTRTYKGNFWSRMTGRQNVRAPETPGPGEYEHEVKKTPTQVQCEKIREAKRAASRQSRYLDILYRNKMRENFPAPNAYDTTKSSFNKHKKASTKCRRHTSEPPPFGSTSKRFERGEHRESPGPGTYEVGDRRSCTPSIYGAPFGTTSSRLRGLHDTAGPDYLIFQSAGQVEHGFCYLTNISHTAPSDYHTNIGSLAYESAKRFKFEWPRPTNQAPTERTKTEKDSGAPFYYYDRGEVSKSTVHHAAFKSKTERFQTPRREAEAPDPGTYETGLAFKANRDKCDFLCRRLAPGFHSRADRFPKVPKGIDMHVPGATRYNVSGDIGSNVKGGVIAHPRRRKHEGHSGPGPAHYNMSSSVESSVLKKTFNVTLTQQGPPTLVLHVPKTQSRRKRVKKQPPLEEPPDYTDDFKVAESPRDYDANYDLDVQTRDPSPEYDIAPEPPVAFQQEPWANYRSTGNAPRLVPPLNVCRTYVTSYN